MIAINKNNERINILYRLHYKMVGPVTKISADKYQNKFYVNTELKDVAL